MQYISLTVLNSPACLVYNSQTSVCKMWVTGMLTKVPLSCSIELGGSQVYEI